MGNIGTGSGQSTNHSSPGAGLHQSESMLTGPGARKQVVCLHGQVSNSSLDTFPQAGHQLYLDKKVALLSPNILGGGCWMSWVGVTLTYDFESQSFWN